MIKHFLVTIDDNINKPSASKLLGIISLYFAGSENCKHAKAISVEPLDIVDHNKYPLGSCSCPPHIGYSEGPDGQVLCNRCMKPNPKPSITTNLNQ